MERSPLPAIGEHIGCYTVLEHIGDGAMGTVYLASDPELVRRVAVKVLTDAPRDDSLLDEARALARLQHPNVVAVHDVGRWNQCAYIAMEYIAGVSLASWLTTHLDWRERLAVFRQAALGLAAAHRAELVHHDVKPSNIMVGDDGRVRLVDFGLARTTPDFVGFAAGTPRYVSPEQWRGEAADARADQYSLCVALHEAVLGVHPTNGEVHRVVPPATSDVPQSIREAIIRGLAVDPARRHPDIEALLDALELPDRSHRRTWTIVAISAAALGVAGAVASQALQRSAARQVASGSAAVLAAPLPDDPFRVTVHRLSNGLTVYISPKHDRPRFHALWRFRGGRGEYPGIAFLGGLLAQNGTEKLGTTDFAQEKPHLDRIASLYHQRAATRDATERTRLDAEIDKASTAAAAFEVPGELGQVLHSAGATTVRYEAKLDESQFEIDLPSNRLETWADLEADRWTHSVGRLFRSTTATAMVGVQRELSHAENRAADASEQTVFWPNAYDPRGVHRQLRAAAEQPLEDVRRFMQEHFVPNNAELILTGDLDPITAIPVLERAFAAWQPGPLPPMRGVDPPPLAAPATLLVPSSSEHMIAYHWTFPALENEGEIEVFTLLVRALLDDAGDDMQLLRVGSFLARRHFAIIKVGTPDMAKVDHVIDQLVTGTFSDELLATVKRNLAVRELMAVRDNGSIAQRIAQAPIGTPWQDRHAHELSRDKVTHADILRIAHHILGRPRLTVHVEPGDTSTAPVTVPHSPEANFAAHGSAGATALVERELAPVQPRFLLEGRDYEWRSTPAGDLVYVRDPKARMFDLELRFEVGFYELPNLCTALSAQGADPAFVRLTWRHALQVQLHCSVLYSTIKLSGLDEELPAAIDLVRGMFGEASGEPSDDALASGLRTLQYQKAQRDGEVTMTGKVLDSLAMYGPHSPAIEWMRATVDRDAAGATVRPCARCSPSSLVARSTRARRRDQRPA